ncbi:hypothetical protein SAMN04488515_3164 [Cognatiyoonia koreensis]|uniref:Uncharacterized protein n=1 Tax=Cognatiyoonia koreensis TaxID=364200 RepID=A0A1I0RS52_9RHOB|nr:hypothetical protein [Cognatiyoonia koreensis]SEW44167.1 hypothetical protein SAMN04488515_3164 [Cognatiyoonia koreensis]
MVGTTADAQGNASAQLYILASAPPDQTPFKDYLADHEIDRHFYFNDEILLLAERIDQLVGQDDAVEDRRRPNLERQLEIARADNNTALASHIEQILADLPAESNRFAREIASYEQQILAELDEVRAEYRQLAETLNDGRRAYVHHVGLLQYGSTRPAYSTGTDALGAPIGNSQMIAAQSMASNYERVWTDYKLLEQGICYTTTREALTNFVWGAIAAIATEIATAGIAKFVRIGRVLQWAARGRAGQMLIGRYNALKDRTKDILDRLRRTRRSERPRDLPNDGTTNTGTGPRAVTRTCATGACR